MFMCLNVEKSLTLSHHISKFSGFRHCLSGDIMFLVVEVQDSTCFLISIIIIFSKAHDISYYKPNIFHTKTLVSTKINLVLVIRLWITIYESYIKKFWYSVQNHRVEGEIGKQQQRQSKSFLSYAHAK